jgi:hypothetical protein
VDIGVDEGGVGRALPRDFDRLCGNVDGRYQSPQLDKLRRRLASRTLKVENVLARDLRQELADPVRNAELTGHRLGPPPVDLVPRFPVLVARLHASFRSFGS